MLFLTLYIQVRISSESEIKMMLNITYRNACAKDRHNLYILHMHTLYRVYTHFNIKRVNVTMVADSVFFTKKTMDIVRLNNNKSTSEYSLLWAAAFSLSHFRMVNPVL